MVCFSYDADGDESTPPVTIEFNGVVPSKKSIQIPKPHSTAAAHHVRDEQPASLELVPRTIFYPLHCVTKSHRNSLFHSGANPRPNLSFFVVKHSNKARLCS